MLIGRSRLGALNDLYVVWGIVLVVGNGLWIATLGFAGAGWGGAIVNGCFTLALLRRIDRREMHVGREGGRILRQAAVGAVAAGAAATALLFALRAAVDLDGRFAALAAAILTGVVFGGTFALWAGLSGFVPREELFVLRELLPSLARRGDHPPDGAGRSASGAASG